MPRKRKVDSYSVSVDQSNGIAITIFGPPIYKKRPRMTCRYGKPIVYQDQDEKKISGQLKQLLEEYRISQRDDWQCFYLTIMTKDKVHADVDNYLKFYMDLLNGICYPDDACFMEAHVVNVITTSEEAPFVIVQLA